MTTPRTRKANAPAMDNAPEPQDHKSPAQREAEAIETVTVPFRGIDFEIPVTDDWTIDALEAFTAGDQFRGLREVLGQEQYDTFKKNFNRRRYLDEFSKLMSEELGLDTPGN